MGEKRNGYRLLVGKPEGNRPLRRPRLRCLDNITMDLVEVGLGDADWIGLAQDRDRLLVGKPEGRRPLGRPRRRWLDNIRMDLGKMGWGDVDRIGVAQDRDSWRALVNSVLNLRVP
jgi:hypothetical protein